VIAEQTAGTVGPLFAGRYADPDSSTASDAALQVDCTAASIDVAIVDLNAIAIGPLARPAVGDDENTPAAIIARARDGCAGGSGDAGGQSTSQNNAAEKRTSHRHLLIRARMLPSDGM
jgi:hypothetical protein